MLDDTDDADVLSHLIPAITFIEDEMGKGRGVLVHCQAGVSELFTCFFGRTTPSVAQFRPQCSYRRCLSYVLSKSGSRNSDGDDQRGETQCLVQFYIFSFPTSSLS